MSSAAFDPKNELPFVVEFKNVFRKIGKVSYPRELKLSQLGLKEDQKYFFIIHWPREWRFFGLNASPVAAAEPIEAPVAKPKLPAGFAMFGGASKTEETELVPFSDDQQKLRANLLKILGPEKVGAGFADFESKRKFLYRESTGKDSIRLNFRVDTDAASFLKWTSPNPRGRTSLEEAFNDREHWLVLSCLAFAIGENAGAVQDRKLFTRVGLQLSSCRELEKCDGHVAFDFGNNGSTMAFIPNGARSAAAIQLVSAEPRAVDGSGQVDSLVSAIRVTEFSPPPRDPEDPENKKGVFAMAEWNIGKETIKYGKGALVDGLKKLLADPNPLPQVNLELDKGDRAMPKSNAAELYLSSLFQAFHRQKLSLAMPLTVTYPSTYSQREIFRLFRAITRSFYRALKHPGLPDEKTFDLAYRLIKTPLDEASAAAIYFIYRDFIEGPGQTAGFKYLYPHGVNLLLYDCGGGTTDISLIHAYPKLTERVEVRDDETIHHEVWQVKLSVIGRTGLRSFGGEDITAAVFLAAKWMLAHIVAPDVVPAPTPDVARNLKGHRELRLKWNKYLPTAWVAGDQNVPLVTDENKIKYAKSLTHQFTNYAELLKIWLSSDIKTRGAAPDITGNTDISRELEKAGKLKLSDILSRFKERAAELEAIVDAMIQPQIDLSIEAANNLIRDRLVKPTSGPMAVPVLPDGSEVETPVETEADEDPSRAALVLAPDSCMHWLYVVGQASLYPLISKRLKDSAAIADLSASWLEENRMVFEQESLKNAVVKGAALARMAVTTVEDTEFVWDVTLSERLAFDVGLMFAGRGPRLLFEENQYYDELEPVPLETAMGALDGQTLRLYRRWPGMPRMERNEEWQPYILFEFPEPPAGRIAIYYDSNKSREGEPAFCVYVESSNKEYVGTELTEDRYIPPLQRGDL